MSADGQAAGSDAGRAEWPDAEPNADGLIAEWYSANADGELHVQRCISCGLYRHPPRYRCGLCHSEAREMVPAGTAGTIVSWTVTHKPLHPGFGDMVPYVIAVVETQLGTRLFCIVRGAKSSDMAPGREVVIAINALPSGAGVPFAELA